MFAGREWLFSEIRKWLQGGDSRLLLLTGDAGVGKSAIAAQMTARLNVRGVHFCSWSSATSWRAQDWLQGLIYQLAAQFEPYREEIQRFDEPNWSDPPEVLFRRLIGDRLRACADRLKVAEPWVFVVDGLDESVARAGYDLARVLTYAAGVVPEWLRLIVTSRPDRELVAHFGRGRDDVQVRHRHLYAHEMANREDVRGYIETRVAGLSGARGLAMQAEAAERLTHLAGGNFLIARMVLDALERGEIAAADLRELPGSLAGLYHRMFLLRFGETGRYGQDVRPVLDCLAAARGAVPEAVLDRAMGADGRDASAGVLALSQFLTRASGGLRLFHQSCVEWLLDREASAGFAASRDRGDDRLAQACWQEFQAGVGGMSGYAVANLAWHLCAAGRWDELALAISSPELKLFERWVEHGEGDEGIACLTGLIREGSLPPVHVAALATQLARIHSNRGRYDEARGWLEEAVGRTSRKEGRRTRAVALHELGSLHLYRGDRQKAVRAYREALGLCVRGRPVYRDEAAANRVALATVAFAEYRWSEVLRLSRRALTDAESVGDSRHQIAAERLISFALDDLGRHDEAQGCLERALELSRRFEARTEEARVLAALGWLKYAQATLARREPVEAREWFEKTMEVAEASHNLYCLLDGRLGMGYCSLAGGEIEQAAEWFALVNDALPAQAHAEFVVGTRMGRAGISHQLAQVTDAEVQYGEAVATAEAVGFRGWAARGLVGMGALRWHAGRQQEAEDLWARARRHAQLTSPRAQKLTSANIDLCKTGPLVTPR